jgi:hypothetical protein
MAVFYIDSVAQDTLSMVKGNIYRFDQNNGSNSAAPLSLSETEDGEANSGAPYTIGVSYWLNNLEVNRTTYLSGFSSAANRFMQVQVDVGAPATLYYYAVGTPQMGGAITITA